MSSPLANRSGETASGRTLIAALAPIRSALGRAGHRADRADPAAVRRIGPGQPFGQDQQGRPPAPQLEQPGDVLGPVLRRQRDDQQILGRKVALAAHHAVWRKRPTRVIRPL